MLSPRPRSVRARGSTQRTIPWGASHDFQPSAAVLAGRVFGTPHVPTDRVDSSSDVDAAVDTVRTVLRGRGLLPTAA